MDRERVNVTKACEILGIAKTTLYRLRDRGYLHAANENKALARPRRLEFYRDDIEHIKAYGFPVEDTHLQMAHAG